MDGSQANVQVMTTNNESALTQLVDSLLSGSTTDFDIRMFDQARCSFYGLRAPFHPTNKPHQFAVKDFWTPSADEMLMTLFRASLCFFVVECKTMVVCVERQMVGGLPALLQRPLKELNQEIGVRMNEFAGNRDEDLGRPYEERLKQAGDLFRKFSAYCAQVDEKLSENEEDAMKLFDSCFRLCLSVCCL